MTNDLLISVSGIRGVVDKTFTNELVTSWSRAFAKFCRKKNTANCTIVIGRDTRESGVWALKTATEALTKEGCNVVSVDIATTPTIELAVTDHQAAGGIIITASHNPIEWNGLKFLGRDGIFLNEAEIKETESYLNQETVPENQGTTSEDKTATQRHVKKVLETLPIDIDKIKKRKFRVALDPVNGAGAITEPILLEALGCEVVTINAEPSGIFGHTPEPRPENLIDLCSEVKKIKADIGLAVDPDADRLALIDEKGEPISEEYTLALATLAVLKSGDQVVANLSTSRMIDDIAAIVGAKVSRTPVGERHVVEGMRNVNAIIGGEGNGGVIFPACHEGRDSLVGIALILNLLAEKNKTVSEIISSFTKYIMVKEKFPRKHNFDTAKLKNYLMKFYSEAKFSEIDGIRMDVQGAWTHIRPSNTEPIVRIITEATSEELFEKISNTAKEALTSL